MTKTTPPREPPAVPAKHFPDRGQTFVYTDEPIFKLSVDAYHELIRSGRLTSDDKVELLEGALVHRMSKNPPHRTSKYKLNAVFSRLLPPGWFYLPEDAITLADSEPEPDGMVVRGTIDDYAERHPYAGDVGLIIEVSDSTLRRDRGVKRRVYARAGVDVYWIVNLVTREIEVHTNPVAGTDPPIYAETRNYTETESIAVVLDGKTALTINAGDVLP